jgi:hypothetical protein
MTDRDRIAAVVVEAEDPEGSAIARASAIIEAMSVLARAGYRLLLVQPGEHVIRRRHDRRRRWWHRLSTKEER